MASRSRKTPMPAETSPASPADAAPFPPTAGLPEPDAATVPPTDAANPPGSGVPGGSPAATEKAPVIRVRSKIDGFRRGGIAHFRTPRDFLPGELPEDVLRAIEAEPMLDVERIDPEVSS